MKRAVYRLAAVCAFALVLLGAQSLVEGPPQAEDRMLPPPPLHAYFDAVMEAADVSAAALQTGEQTSLWYAICEATRVQAPALAPLCESNGWPITSQSWARTVYTACPPEGEVG